MKDQMVSRGIRAEKQFKASLWPQTLKGLHIELLLQEAYFPMKFAKELARGASCAPSKKKDTLSDTIYKKRQEKRAH